MTSSPNTRSVATPLLEPAPSSPSHWTWLAFLLLGLLALRIVILVAATAPGDLTLQVDEAQYWLWSRDLHWGYYSKPPVIAALIAVSTTLFGNSILGVKLLTMMLYPVIALLLARLARRMALSACLTPTTEAAAQQQGQWADRVSLWAAALFMTSPLAGLLGLAVTTDAPLLLSWVVCATFLWRALQDGRRSDWLWLGLAWAAGVLSKYTMLSLLLSILPLIWTHRGLADRRGVPSSAAPEWWRPASNLSARLLGLVLAGGVILLILVPHLAWNADHGWPTLHHTVEITAEAKRTDGLGRLSSVGEFLGGQWVQFGPFWVFLVLGVWWALRRARPGGDRSPATTAAGDDGFDEQAWNQVLRFALWLGVPLVLVGLVQAWNAKAQLNWTAPAAHGLFLWGALRLGRLRVRPALRAAGGVLAAHVLLVSLIPLATPIAQAFGRPAERPLPRSADIWVRMRGWGPALTQLAPLAEAHLRRYPQAQILGLDRQVISMGAYVWRDLALPSPQLGAPAVPPTTARWVAWTPPTQRVPGDHFQLTTRWASPGTPAAAQPMLVVSADDLPAALLERLDALTLLGEVSVPEGADRTLHLRVWSAHPQGAGRQEMAKP